MDMYRQAYESYKIACESYGMETMNFSLFIKHLTVEQLSQFSKTNN